MTNLQIISEKPVNISELRDELEKIQKRDKELGFRASKTLEYLQQVAPEKKADDLAQRLTKLEIPRLREQHIHKIVDIMPTSIKSLKVVLQGYTLTVNNENLKKIVDAINEFLKK